jgi:hypothetical protein
MIGSNFGRSVFALAIIMLTHAACAGDLQQEASRLRARCAAIPADRYSTGLIGNPSGYETLFERSACVQRVAMELRDHRLCRQARERTSWFFDGSGISPAVCDRMVTTQIQQDATDALRLRKLQKLTAIALTRDGNGRDIDAHLRTSGGVVASYQLTFSVHAEDGVEHNLRSERQPMDDQPGSLVLLIPLPSLMRALPGHSLDHPITLRARLELVPASLDEQAVYSHLPRNGLNSVVEMSFVLSALQREPLTQWR